MHACGVRQVTGAPPAHRRQQPASWQHTAAPHTRGRQEGRGAGFGRGDPGGGCGGRPPTLTQGTTPGSPALSRSRLRRGGWLALRLAGPPYTNPSTPPTTSEKNGLPRGRGAEQVLHALRLPPPTHAIRIWQPPTHTFAASAPPPTHPRHLPHVPSCALPPAATAAASAPRRR